MNTPINYTPAGLIQINAFEEALSYAGMNFVPPSIDQLVVKSGTRPNCFRVISKVQPSKEMGLELFIDPDSSMQAIQSLTGKPVRSRNLIDNALEATLNNHGKMISLSMTDLVMI